MQSVLKRFYFSFSALGFLRSWFELLLIQIVIFQGIRIFLLFYNIPASKNLNSNLALSFFYGLSFDIAVASYSLVFSFFVFIYRALLLAKFDFPLWSRLLSLILFIPAVLANLMDMFYWPYFDLRLTAGVLQWLDSPAQSFKFAFESYPMHLLFLMWFAIVCLYTYVLYVRYKKNNIASSANDSILVFPYRFLIVFICSLLFFVGVRGRLEVKSPLRISAAFFSEDNFANQLSLNSFFSFIHSIELKPKYLKYKDILAPVEFSELEAEFKQTHFNKEKQSALDLKNQKPNIIIIIMESFAFDYLSDEATSLNSKWDLTPKFNVLKKEARFYSKFFSNTAHTGHGLFNIISGIANPIGKSQTKQSTGIREHNSFPSLAKKIDYTNLFFTTHDAQFDNMQAFAMINSFHKVYDDSDYDAISLGATGAPDGTMFAYSISILSDLQAKDKNFIAVYLTGTNHGPWNIPSDAKIKKITADEHKDFKIFNAVRYADQSMYEFIESLKLKNIYQNSVIFILGDHGLPLDKESPFPISRFHTPLLILDPSAKYFQPGRVEFSASQVNIAPSIAEILQQDNDLLAPSLLGQDQDYWVGLSFADQIGFVFGDDYCSSAANAESKIYSVSTKKWKQDSKSKYDLCIQKAKFFQQFNIRRLLQNK